MCTCGINSLERKKLQWCQVARCTTTVSSQWGHQRRTYGKAQLRWAWLHPRQNEAQVALFFFSLFRGGPFYHLLLRINFFLGAGDLSAKSLYAYKDMVYLHLFIEISVRPYIMIWKKKNYFVKMIFSKFVCIQQYCLLPPSQNRCHPYFSRSQTLITLIKYIYKY